MHYTTLHAGMDAEGIYRISGKTNDILRIKKEFDNSESVNVSALRLYKPEITVKLEQGEGSADFY